MGRGDTRGFGERETGVRGAGGPHERIRGSAVAGPHVHTQRARGPHARSLRNPRQGSAAVLASVVNAPSYAPETLPVSLWDRTWGSQDQKVDAEER